MSSEAHSNLQFSTRAVLWIMLTLGMALAYVRTADAKSLETGAVYAALGLVAGCLIGWVSGKLADALFWSLLITLLAYLSVFERVTHEAVAYGWGAVGALCGGVCGVRKPKGPVVGALVSGLLGLAAMAGCVAFYRQPMTAEVSFDVASAGVVGVLLRVLVELVGWFESQSRQPRSIIAAWLTLSVIVGNWLVPWMTGIR
jgi:hypothetical protein